MTAPERPQDGAGEARPLNVVGSAGEPNPSVAAPTTQYAVRTSRGFLVTFACLGNAAMAAEQCGGQLLSRTITEWQSVTSADFEVRA